MFLHILGFSRPIFGFEILLSARNVSLFFSYCFIRCTFCIYLITARKTYIVSNSTPFLTRQKNNTINQKKSILRGLWSWHLSIPCFSMCADLSPGDFVHVIGDAHVYTTHVQALEEQMQKQLPVSNYWVEHNIVYKATWQLLTSCLHLTDLFTGLSLTWISSADFEDKSSEEGYRCICCIRLFKLVSYDPHQKLEMKMAV